MSRSSHVTLRSEPVAPVTLVSGPFHVRAETLSITTDKPLQVLDLTDEIMSRVVAMGVREGTGEGWR